MMDPRQQRKRDSAIAAAVTFVALLALLLLLFFGGISYTDRGELAENSTPELMPLDDEMFIEPEVLTNLGEENAQTQDEPAPAFKGTPEEAPEENTKQITPGKNPKPAPPQEKKVSSNKENPVKTTEPSQESEEKRKVTSKIADKFPTNNGASSGTSGTSGAGGKGSGVSGSVAGRTFKGCPLPSVELRNKVVVEVRVTIDAAGKVVSATARSKQGTPSKAILDACERAARSARWSEDPGTPSAKGTLTFTIVPK